MPQSQYAVRVAGQIEEEPAEVGDIATIIDLVLQVLAVLPCLKNMTPEEKVEFAASHPTMTINATVRELKHQMRKSGERMKHKDVRRIALQMYEDAISNPQETVMGMTQ